MYDCEKFIEQQKMNCDRSTLHFLGIKLSLAFLSLLVKCSLLLNLVVVRIVHMVAIYILQCSIMNYTQRFDANIFKFSLY